MNIMLKTVNISNIFQIIYIGCFNAANVKGPNKKALQVNFGFLNLQDDNFAATGTDSDGNQVSIDK